MNGFHPTLPEGRRGQALALALALLAALAAWSLTAAPLLSWYAARQETLAHQRAMAAHMQALGRELPALRAALAKAGLHDAGAQTLLTGDTDVIAGANLQAMLQNLAAQSGTSLSSAALQPAVPVGGLRRIGVAVSVSASWPVLVGLLQAIATARPRMTVDQLSITSAAGQTGDAPQFQASFTVCAFRAGAP